MAHLIIWGDPRSVLGGAAQAGAEEVRSLAALETALDGRGAALVLTGPEQLAAEHDAVEAWLRNGGGKRAVLVAVSEASDTDQLLQRFPFLHDVISRPVSSARLRVTLERAFEAMNSRGALRQLQAAYERRGTELSVLNKIGMQLSAERDIDKLLDLILQKSREITGADAGSLYLVERAPKNGGGGGVDRLRFKLAQNDTMPLPFEEYTVPLDEKSAAGYVAVTNKKQNLADAYNLPDGTPFHISRSFDEVSGYRTKSMLVVPMCDHHETVIGVVQLINKKREPAAVLWPTALVEEQVIPFTSVDEDLVESLASQAAVAFENADLLLRMRRLFDDFVHAAVAAIEQRDPTTSGHSERVAILTVGLMEKVDQVSSGPFADVHFTHDQVEEVRYASLLHDFGKVAVQEKYLRKGNKLYASQLIGLRQRFAYILKSIEADYLRARLAALESGAVTPESLAAIEADYLRRRTEAERVKDMVQQANQPTVVEEERFRALMSLPSRHFASYEELQAFPVETWAEGPYLSSDEVQLLSIRKGSLSDEERQKIQEHVTETWHFLQKLPWTGELKHVPEIAYAHHEKLDGSGYPRGLLADAIPRQSRMMTISDIYDALVAWDRPYKKSVSEERAIDILRDEAREGKIDQDLLTLFLEAQIYRHEGFRERLQKKA
jgi:HD-GYP domain-containing protein (c-di-GMP phosphodiesterase class II)